jgi:hypothetical protein
MSLVAFCALFATVGSGCVVPPGSDQFTKPVASNPAGAEPVMLNGAGGKIANPAKGDVKAVAAAPATGEPRSDPPAPLLAATPVPQVPPTPAVAAVAPDPAGNDADAKNADGFPNINTPPKEPGSKLLPDDERARVISELEALRNKGGSATKDAGSTQVAKKTSGKKGTVKCGDGTMAATSADCKATQ